MSLEEMRRDLRARFKELKESNTKQFKRIEEKTTASNITEIERAAILTRVLRKLRILNEMIYESAGERTRWNDELDEIIAELKKL